MIKGLKKHNEDGAKTNEIVKYLKIELDKISKQVDCLSDGTNKIINEFNNNLGQINIASKQLQHLIGRLLHFIFN